MTAPRSTAAASAALGGAPHGVEPGGVPRLVLVGDGRHGVARYAARIAASLPRAEVVRTNDPREVAGGGPVHLHFTDRLWGDSPEEAAARALAITAPFTVTLHDVPQPSDGAASLRRRAAAYGRVAAAARGVAVCSAHEARLLAAHVPGAPAAHVIPHALDTEAARRCADAAPGEDTVAVLGFVYPGKGHEAVIDAVGSLDEPRPAVLAVGAPSSGHERDVEALDDRAARAGVRFDLTGFVADANLPGVLARVGVPVAAHAHLSASGSIATWVEAGRRPLVIDGDYARELAASRPDAVTIVPADGLGAAISAARRDPSGTRIPPGADLGPSLADTAAAHVEWWR